MTTGLCSLGTVTSILDSGYGGFSYPQNATVVPLLSDGTTVGGHAVLQSAAFGFRQAPFSFVAEGADVATVQGYYENRDLVTFTEWDGTARGVRILDFAKTLKFGGVWDVSLTMLEYTEPGS